ncbi:hypothetical protein [Natrinema pellirubrum]|uniref:hypothetical protein n=1 Tax=Natrinema pellirubrum TaxID=69525 RepID=UPI001267EE23|nr:hypothetical protein [Natrinema pellirubrum]
MSEDVSDEYDPIKFNPLREMLKDETDCQTTKDGVELLKDQLEFLAIQLWIQASKQTRDDGRSQVTKDDVQDAYDELREPHDLLKESADEMREKAREMDKLAEKSPVFANKDNDD